MSASSRRIGRLETIFDHEGIVANAGLLVPATLMVRLGQEDLIDDGNVIGSGRGHVRPDTELAADVVDSDHGVGSLVRIDSESDPEVVTFLVDG